MNGIKFYQSHITWSSNNSINHQILRQKPRPLFQPRLPSLMPLLRKVTQNSFLIDHLLSPWIRQQTLSFFSRSKKFLSKMKQLTSVMLSTENPRVLPWHLLNFMWQVSPLTSYDSLVSSFGFLPVPPCLDFLAYYMFFVLFASCSSSRKSTLSSSRGINGFSLCCWFSCCMRCVLSWQPFLLRLWFESMEDP